MDIAAFRVYIGDTWGKREGTEEQQAGTLPSPPWHPPSLSWMCGGGVLRGHEGLGLEDKSGC